MAQALGSFEKVLRLGEGRRLKRLRDQASYIGSLEPDFERLSDADLQAKTGEFRQRLENGSPLDTRGEFFDGTPGRLFDPGDEVAVHMIAPVS